MATRLPEYAICDYTFFGCIWDEQLVRWHSYASRFLRVGSHDLRETFQSRDLYICRKSPYLDSKLLDDLSFQQMQRAYVPDARYSVWIHNQTYKIYWRSYMHRIDICGRYTYCVFRALVAPLLDRLEVCFQDYVSGVIYKILWHNRGDHIPQLHNALVSDDHYDHLKDLRAGPIVSNAFYKSRDHNGALHNSQSNIVSL